MKNLTFNKAEKLKSRKSIESLFRSGQSVSSPPFKLLYRKAEFSDYPAKMTVAIPKKLIRKAVERNLLKRRTREAYRQYKNLVYKELRKGQPKSFEMVFLYQSKDIADYQSIKRAVNVLLIRFLENQKLTGSNI